MMLMILVLWILRKSLNHLSWCHLGVQLGVFWSFGSNSEFFRWQRSIKDAKCAVLHCFFPSSITSLFLTFVSCHAGISSSFSLSFCPAAFASSIYIAWGIGINLCTKLWWINELIPSPAMWSSWSLCRVPPKSFLTDSSASTMHAYFVLRVPEELQVSRHLLLLISQGMDAGIGTSNFLHAFLMVSLNSSRALHLSDQRNKYLSIFEHYRALVFR